MHSRLFGLLACLLLAGFVASAAPTAPFVLRDYLNRAWRNERVTFPLSPEQLKHAQAGHALAGPDGAPVLYQIVNDSAGKPAKIVFLANLDPFETREYAFTDKVAKVDTDLKVEELADGIRVSNSLTGIAINTTLDGGIGPIAGVKLNSGIWVGGSTLTTDQPVAKYEAKVTVRGPVYAEAVCSTEFADGSKWKLRVQVIANEPVVLVDEISAVKAKAVFTVNLDKGFTPTKILYRYGMQVPNGAIGKNETVDLGTGRVFTLEPWLRWSEHINQGNVFSLYKTDTNDLLGVGAREAGVWIDPKGVWADQMPNQAQVIRDDKGINMALGLKTGQRKWMFMALDRDASLKDLTKQDNMQTPLPTLTFIKHGQFPLDLVKDYVLNWKSTDTYPRLLMSPAEVARFKAAIKDPDAYQKAIPRVLGNPNPLTQWNMEAAITTYFATGDEKVADLLTKNVLINLQACVDAVTVQSAVPLGAAPHHLQIIGDTALLADAALSNPKLDPIMRERILGQLAFMAYTVNRPEFWSPERGYAANPNMTTSVLGYQVALACSIGSHPMSKTWTKTALDSLKDQLDTWSDDNGGWLEAPHYAMVAYDQILGSFRIGEHNGFPEYMQDPKLVTVINWFSKISTPPDTRLGGDGFRHLPPAGNTYLQEASGEFGIVANLFRDKDPAFAAQMQWMYQQQKSFAYPGIGGGYPAFAGYRGLMLDPSIPAKAPNWTSDLFPRTGAILRTGFPSPRETQLYLIGGTNHAHYDDDSGSIMIYGKGRILAEDFGYYIPERSEHSLLQTPAAGGIMTLQSLTKSDLLDCLTGTCGGWTRQVALVKDADPMGPNYFVLADGLKVALPATFRLWCNANAVQPQGNAALVVGREDVDMDVIFAAPAGLALTTHPATHTANCGLSANGNTGRMDMTQISLDAPSAKTPGFLTVLYPRLKTEKGPTVTTIADGKGVQVVTAAGTDIVFLSATPFKYDDGGVQFEGTVGIVRVRDGKFTVKLGAPGRIAAGGKAEQNGTIQAGSANLIPNGDFENGTQNFFVADMSNYGTSAAIFKGSPVPGDDNNKYCAAIKMTGKSGVSGAAQPIYIDSAKTYRLSCKFFTTAKFNGAIAGYGNNDKGQQCRNDAGGVWQWDLANGRQGPTGPTNGWQALTCTIGPAGSGAQYIWPKDIISTGFGFWMRGDEGATVYIDDISLEELPAK